MTIVLPSLACLALRHSTQCPLSLKSVLPSLPPQVPPQYNAQYAVKDDYSGNDFGAQENRDGYSTQGSYHVLLPDGRLQRVTYYVDGDSGYVAEVTYEGEAQYTHAPSYGHAPAPSYGHVPAPAYSPRPAYG